MTNPPHLNILLKALQSYPAPARVTAAPGRTVYVPPIEYSMRLYAAHFQDTESELRVQSAFATLLPKLLDRCQTFTQRVLNSIVDRGQRAGGIQIEYTVLTNELCTLAAVFVGPPGSIYTGPFSKQYDAVCAAIEQLSYVMS